MASKEFPLVPEKVQPVKTKYRKIVTAIPAPQSIALLKKLRATEPRSMGGQPPVIWHHGKDFCIFDPYGNQWLDFTSGVLVAACGHGRPEMTKAVVDMAKQGLLHAYCFPTEVRAQLVAELGSWLPKPLKRVFLLTTGSEATECCIKLARTRGMELGGKKKSILVTFQSAFHGRTLGAQLAGGSPALKSWIGDLDERFVQVPYPDGFRQQDTSFDVFEKTLAAKGINPDDVCGVMAETFQGGNAILLPVAYAQALRKWCNKHQALLMFDEIQAGFGRTGKAFAFMHLGIVPDLVACGKGISGGLPLSAVLGTQELMDIYGPGEMTSTHSANPICSAAALANLQCIKRDKLVQNAAKLAPQLAEGCRTIAEASQGHIGRWSSTGLVGALQFTKPGTTDPDPDTAWEVVRRTVQRGVLLFAPVGLGNAAIKINPPLTINAAALAEGLEVIKDVVECVVSDRGC